MFIKVPDNKGIHYKNLSYNYESRRSELSDKSENLN